MQSWPTPQVARSEVGCGIAKRVDSPSARVSGQQLHTFDVDCKLAPAGIVLQRRCCAGRGCLGMLLPDFPSDFVGFPVPRPLSSRQVAPHRLPYLCSGSPVLSCCGNRTLDTPPGLFTVFLREPPSHGSKVLFKVGFTPGLRDGYDAILPDEVVQSDLSGGFAVSPTDFC